MSKSELEKVRDAMRKKKGGSGRDPHEWRADKAEAGQDLKWKFFILPPLDTMDLWYYQHGAHWIDNKTLECPRLHDETECPLCQYGFDKMRETDNKDKRRAIAKAFLSSARYAVNIYFPAFESTPADLRGKVFWYSMSQTIFNLCESVIYRDGPGSGPEPEPFGIFYDSSNAYPLILSARKKGDYNTYDSSYFKNTASPITSKGDEAIQAILDARHDIPSKFPARDIGALQAVVDNLEGKVSVSANRANKAQIDESNTKDTETELETEIEVETESESQGAKATKTKRAVLNPEETEVEVETETETEVEVESEPEATKTETVKVPDEDPELEDLLNQLSG